MARRPFRKPKVDEQWWVGLTGDQVIDVLRADMRRTFAVHTVVQSVAIAAMIFAARVL